MSAEKPHPKAAIALSLIAILAAALSLRTWGIGFGLPYAYHVDELTYVSSALNLGAGVIGKQPNPTGFSNILFGEYALYFIFGRIAGIFQTATDFERAYRADPSVFLTLSRLTSALLSTANVLVVYWLGKTLRDRLTGLLAAAFLSVAFLHVRDSHYGVPDIAATLFVSLAILGCVIGLQKRQWRYVGLGAMAGGLALATKWSVTWVILPIILSTVWLGVGPKHVDEKRLNPSMAVAVVGICLGGGLLIGGFQLFLKPTIYLEYALREARSGTAGGFGFWQIDTVPGWLFYIKTLGYGLGVLMCGLALLGIIKRLLLTLCSRDLLSVLLLVFPIAYFLLMGATRHYFARYALPLVPFLALFAAEGITTIGNWLAARQLRWAQPVVMLLALVALVQPLANSIRHDTLLTRTDTRTLAKAWIEQNIPDGSKIAVDWPTHGPPLATPELSVPDSRRVYDVTLVGGAGLSEHPLAWYRENGYEYLIASSFIYQIPLVFPDKNLERQAFYTALGHELEELQAFSPTADGEEPDFIFDEIYGPLISLWQRERPGPTIKIYRISP
ncbi:MAG: ArnT family glycosyltransferase [Anaerolineae bacterium]